MSTQQTDTIHSRIRKVGDALSLVSDRKTPGNMGNAGYLSYVGLLDAVAPHLKEHSLRLQQSSRVPDSAACIVTTTALVTDAGETASVDYVVNFPSSKVDSHGKPLNNFTDFGASQSYGWRMGLLGLLGQRDGTEDRARAANDQKERKEARPSPDDTIAPRKAALDAVAARIGGAKELKRRLDIIAATEPDAGGFDGQAQTREKLADRMGGDAKGWRGLPAAAFDALVGALTDWPEGL
jgi:hypothetical protein